MNKKQGAPSRLGITKASGMCVTCGKPRATIPIALMGRQFWIHARCKKVERPAS